MHRSKSQITLFSGYHPAHTQKASEGSSTFLDVSLSPPTQSRVRLFKCQGKVWLVAWKMMRKYNRWIWRCRRCCKAKICARICIKSRASQWMSRRLSSSSSKARRSSLKTKWVRQWRRSCSNNTERGAFMLRRRTRAPLPRADITKEDSSHPHLSKCKAEHEKA